MCKTECALQWWLLFPIQPHVHRTTSKKVKRESFLCFLIFWIWVDTFLFINIPSEWEKEMVNNVHHSHIIPTDHYSFVYIGCRFSLLTTDSFKLFYMRKCLRYVLSTCLHFFFLHQFLIVSFCLLLLPRPLTMEEIGSLFGSHSLVNLIKLYEYQQVYRGVYCNFGLESRIRVVGNNKIEMFKINKIFIILHTLYCIFMQLSL